MIVGVIGSGSIGPDLAYGFVSALARTKGSKVYLVDVKQEALDGGVARIQGYIGKGLARGKLSPKAAEAMKGLLVPTLRLSDLADCEYVLEAATEDLPLKRKLLAQLEEVVRDDCLIGFATSGIPRAQIAEKARVNARCFVNHPFFPAWRSLPIEVVLSGDEALGARMVSTLEVLGKVPIVTSDVPCFAADDIFCNYCSEAARIVAEGLATPAQVDAIIHGAIGGGGPFNVLDGTRGNLLVAHCQQLMQEASTGSAWFAPPAILAERGSKAWHDGTWAADPAHDEALREKVLDRILAVVLARTYFVIENDICSARELNWMTRMALGFSQGLADLAEELGGDRVLSVCRKYAEGHPGFELPPGLAKGKLVPFQRHVDVQVADGVAVVRVWRPEVKNALNGRTVRELGETIAALEADTAVTGIVLSSTDGSLAGADIMELSALEGPADCEALAKRGQAVLGAIERCKKPVVAAIDGPVMGGGAELSMACHARVVGPALMLAQPEVNLGIIPGYGGTQRLPRLVGLERAADMLRTGRVIGAADACAWGWAHGEPATDFVGAARSLAREHAAGKLRLEPVKPAPVVVPERLPAANIGHRSRAIDAILVDVLREGLSKPLQEGLAVEAAGFGRCKATVDMDIGMKNFVQNGPRVPAEFLHE